MDHRAFLILLCCLAFGRFALGEKLSPDQKAPLFARGSGGLILTPPRASASASVSVSGGVPVDSNVQREEKETYRTVDGQLVRAVEGSFAYKSPEGLPVAVRYTADENGNRASFRLGAAAGAGAGAGAGARPGAGGGGSGRPGQGPGGGTDRSYLPPN